MLHSHTAPIRCPSILSLLALFGRRSLASDRKSEIAMNDRGNAVVAATERSGRSKSRNCFPAQSISASKSAKGPPQRSQNVWNGWVGACARRAWKKAQNRFLLAWKSNNRVNRNRNREQTHHQQQQAAPLWRIYTMRWLASCVFVCAEGGGARYDRNSPEYVAGEPESKRTSRMREKKNGVTGCGKTIENYVLDWPHGDQPRRTQLTGRTGRGLLYCDQDTAELIHYRICF